MVHVTQIERLLIPGPAGGLEAVLEFDPQATPPYSALVCHPHPLYGGTMHTKIVYRAAKAALQEGLPALRFNFRGVGRSQGQFAHGQGEQEDVRAALGWLRARYPTKRVVLMGFSFGSAVGLRVGAFDGGVVALIGIGLPVQNYDFSYLRSCAKPKLIIEGTKDPFGPRALVEQLVATFAPPRTLHWVEGGDHFCNGRLDEVRDVIRSFIRLPELADDSQTSLDPVLSQNSTSPTQAPTNLPDQKERGPFYCPRCGEEVTDPLACGDCGAVICRRCGTPVEKADELGIG